eukprot:391207_1
MANIIIVGGGIMGVSTALELAKTTECKIMVLEQFSFFDKRTTSIDMNRIMRTDYGDDTMYTNLAQRAMNQWMKWNKKYKCDLFTHNKQLIISTDKFEKNSYEEKTLKLNGISFMNFNQIGNKIPAWNVGIGNNYNQYWRQGYISPNAGWIDAKLTLECMINECKKLNVKFYENHNVTQLIQSDTNTIIGVKSDIKTFYCDKLILCCGAWTNDMLKVLKLPQFKLDFKYINIQAFFKINNDKLQHLFSSKQFPVFLCNPHKANDEGCYYGFSLNKDDGFIKIGSHIELSELMETEHKLHSLYLLNATNDNEIPSHSSIMNVVCDARNKLIEFVKNKLPFGRYLKLDHWSSCYCSCTEDHHWLIDNVPAFNNVSIAAGGSGHVFKFAPILGELIVSCLNKTAHQEIIDRFCWKPRSEKTFWGEQPKSKL